MIEKQIIKAETYKKLRTLQKQYKDLPHGDFLCDGAESVWRLLKDIINKLVERFDKYSSKQLQLFNELFPFFDRVCGYLDDSETKKIPWSIIPSIEDLFSKIKPGTKFIICPIWETNYAIYTKNIIEYLNLKVIQLPGLIFDWGPSFITDCENFLEPFPSGIYFVKLQSDKYSQLQKVILLK